MYIGKQIPEYLLSKLSITDKSASLYWRDAAKQFSFSASGEPTNFAKLGPRGQYGSIKQLAHTAFQYPICRLRRKYKYFDQLLLSGIRITRSQKVLLEQGMLSHIFTLSLCLQELDGFEDATYQCVIGDGMAKMNSLILSNTKSRVLSVNLRPAMLVDYHFLAKIVSPDQIGLITKIEDIEYAQNNSDLKAIFLEADNQNWIRQFFVFCFFNISSMMEMDQETIQSYFEDMRQCKNRSAYFYCCNRIEKTANKVPTRFFDYPWESSKIIVDEEPPWYRYRYNLRKFPFYFKSNPTQHRLIQF